MMGTPIGSAPMVMGMPSPQLLSSRSVMMTDPSGVPPRLVSPPRSAVLQEPVAMPQRLLSSPIDSGRGAPSEHTPVTMLSCRSTGSGVVVVPAFSTKPQVAMPGSCSVPMMQAVGVPPSPMQLALRDTGHHDSHIASLHTAIARRDAQIRELETQLEMKNALVVERDQQIAHLARSKGQHGSMGQQGPRGESSSSPDAQRLAELLQSSRAPRESPGRASRESPGRAPRESPGRAARESPGRVLRTQLHDSFVLEERLPERAQERVRPGNRDTRSAAVTRAFSAGTQGAERLEASHRVAVKTVGQVPHQPLRQSSAPPRQPSADSAVAPHGRAPELEPADRDADEVDDKLRSYFAQYPDFNLDIDKMKAGWYFFGQPIGKKVYIKMNGRGSAVLKIGGGFKALDKFLDEHRQGAALMAARASSSRPHRF